MAADVRLYLDENLSPRIAAQLRLRGIDAVSVRDIELLGAADVQHPERATEEGRVLVTTDVDFLRLAASGIEHAGIVFGQQEVHTVGSWVRLLALLCFVYSEQEMRNHVEYV